MKKVLFATTALVASAGFAAAEVSLSGSAEMGVIGGGAVAANNAATTQFHHDLDVKFSLSGETDNGLTFGATIDLDELDGSASANTTLAPITIVTAPGGDISNTSGPHSVWISGAFGTLTMGDTDGALDWALQEVNLVGGSIDDSETIHAGFNGNAGLDGSNDGQILRYDYSFGDFAFAASVELDDLGATDDVFGLGVTYGADLGGVVLGLGLGYQTFSNLDFWGASVDADFGNGFVAGISYMDMDTAGDHFGIGLGYTMDALSVGLNYGEFSTGADGFGLAVNYDLGGAVVQFGYGDGNVAGDDSWSLGVAMSF